MSEEQLISEFNEAKFQIYRLHNLWLKAEGQRTNGDLVGCRWTLDSAEIELSTDIEKMDAHTKNSNYGEQLEEINNSIKEAIDNKKPGKVYLKLKEKETLLRKIQDESGKGGRYKAPSDDEMM